MAVQKASVVLDCSVSSLIQQCSAAVKSATTVPVAPTLSSHCITAQYSFKGSGRSVSVITAKQLTAHRQNIRKRYNLQNRHKYIINPSRYAQRILQTHPETQLTSRNNFAYNDYKLSSSLQEEQCHSPTVKVFTNHSSSVTLLYQTPPSLQLNLVFMKSPLSLSLPPKQQPLPPTLSAALRLSVSDAIVRQHSPLLDTMCSPSPSSHTVHSSSPHHNNKPTPSQLAFILLKLRGEFPAFFDGHHSLDMYSENMTFENSLGPRPWTIQGSTGYSVLLMMWRVSVKACFSQPRLDLIKISKDTESGVIEARWRVRGRPRTPWNKQEKIFIEAFSTFSVGSDGSIVAHKIDKVMPGRKELNRVMSWLVRLRMALAPSPQHYCNHDNTKTLHDILPHHA